MSPSHINSATIDFFKSKTRSKWVAHHSKYEIFSTWQLFYRQLQHGGPRNSCRSTNRSIYYYVWSKVVYSQHFFLLQPRSSQWHHHQGKTTRKLVPVVLYVSKKGPATRRGICEKEFQIALRENLHGEFVIAVSRETAVLICWIKSQIVLSKCTLIGPIISIALGNPKAITEQVRMANYIWLETLFEPVWEQSSS